MSAGSSGRLSKAEVVTFAVGLLGGLESPIHLEHIAVKAHELAPGAFRWTLDEFSDHIDKELVRSALVEAANRRQRRDEALVEGVLVKGESTRLKFDMWRMTPAGADWMSENESSLAAIATSERPKLPEARVKKIMTRINSSDLYQQYRQAGEVSYSPYDFTDLLDCSPDAPNPVVLQQLELLRGQLGFLGDDDLLTFLDACAAAHARMLEA